MTILGKNIIFKLRKVKKKKDADRRLKYHDKKDTRLKNKGPLEYQRISLCLS